MTNFELAQTLVRLGAVTGMALDGGGSTTMAFDGTLLNRPAGAGAADLDRAAVPLHRRLRAAGGVGRLARRRRGRRPPEPALQARAPLDGDRDPDGARRHASPTRRRRERQPGSYGLPFPPPADPPRVDRPPPVRLRRRRRPRRPLASRRPDSRRTAAGSSPSAAVDDIGQTVRDGAVVHRQHDGRVPEHGAAQALPATARPRSRDHVEAGSGGARRRHRRDAGRRGGAHARQALLPGRQPGARLERPRPATEGGQGRQVRRAGRGEERARHDRADARRPRPADRRPEADAASQ